MCFGSSWQRAHSKMSNWKHYDQLNAYCMKGATTHLEVSQLRQGRVSEPQLGEGTQQSPPPAFHSWNSKNISSLYFKTSDTDIKIHQHITMFQLEGICCISRQRSSGVFPRAAQYASPIGKDENPSTFFGLVWCHWPLEIVAFITDQQITRIWTIAQVFSRVWYFDKVSILGPPLHLILQKSCSWLIRFGLV